MSERMYSVGKISRRYKSLKNGKTHWYTVRIIMDILCITIVNYISKFSSDNRNVKQIFYFSSLSTYQNPEILV